MAALEGLGCACGVCSVCCDDFCIVMQSLGFGKYLHGFESFHRVESALLSTFENCFKLPQDPYPITQNKD